MDEETPPTLNNATQYPYAVIPVPWSAILAAYPYAGSPDSPALTPETVEAR